MADTNAELESDEQGNDVDLEDVEASFEEVLEDDSTEPDTTETEADDTTDDESDSETEDEAEPETDKETEDAEAEDKEPTEDDKKAHNREMAERRLQAKADRDKQLQDAQAQYVADAEADNPQDLAVRQLQVDAYNNKVEYNTNKLTNGYERAIKDFPILSDAAPEIRAEVDGALDAFQALHVEIDQYGNPTNVRGDIYAYLQAKADSIAALTGKGARQQEQAKTKEKSKVTTLPSRAPKTPKKDADIDAFDEEAARW